MGLGVACQREQGRPAVDRVAHEGGGGGYPPPPTAPPWGPNRRGPGPFNSPGSRGPETTNYELATVCWGCWVRWRSGAFEIPYKKCAAREVILRANRCTERITTHNFGGYMKGKDESKSLKRRLLGWPNSLRRKVKAIVQSPCQPLENDHSRRQN